MTTTEEAPEKGRFLSQLDFEVQRGTLPSSDGGKVLPLDVVYVHIPKTAGDSVMTASSKHLLKGQHLQGNREAAYLEHDTQARLKSKQHRSLAFVMLRNPLTHVLSQFLECKYDGWGQYVTEGLGFPGYGKLDNALDGFDEWIAHFALRPNNIDVVKKKKTEDAFNCYDPWNLQTRYLSTGGKAFLAHFRRSKEDEKTLEKAKTHLHDEQLLVGITEHFSASMCLLEHAATKGKLVSEACLSICDGSPPPHRALATADAPHKSHHVPPHSLDMVANQTTLEHLQTLTQLDQELYNAAASLFQENIDRIHQETGVDLLCREKKTTTKKKGGKQKNKKKTNAKNPAAKDKKKAPVVVEDAAASKEQPLHEEEEEELLNRETNTHGVGGSVGAEETEEETGTQQGASVTTSVMANATDVMPPLLTSGIVLTSNATEFSTPELPPSSVSGSTDSNDSILLFQLTSVLAVVGYVLVFLGLRKRGWFRFSPSAQEYSLVETNTEKEDV